MFLYESHLGGLYFSENPIDYKDLHCDTCGDYDQELGEFNTEEELVELLKECEFEDGFIEKMINIWKGDFKC